MQAEDIIGEQLPAELSEHIERVIDKYHWLDDRSQT